MTQVYAMTATQLSQPVAGSCVFSLGDDPAYQDWRDAKLAAYPRLPEGLKVEVSDLAAITPAETRAMLAACGRANMCLYRSRQHLGDPQATRRALAAFVHHFGLIRSRPIAQPRPTALLPLKWSQKGVGSATSPTQTAPSAGTPMATIIMKGLRG